MQRYAGQVACRSARPQEGIDLVHLPDEGGPGPADLKGRPIVRAGDWVRRLGFREEPVPLEVAPRPIGVPAIERVLRCRRRALPRRRRGSGGQAVGDALRNRCARAPR